MLRKLTKNFGGEKGFVFHINYGLTKSVMAAALATDCWENNEEFDRHMTKTKALRIIRNSIMTHGYNGVYRDNWESASDEFVYHFNAGYENALEWISKNYPQL